MASPPDGLTAIADLGSNRFKLIFGRMAGGRYQELGIQKPKVGVGGFAARRAQEALAGLGIPVGEIAHPSPANPRANRGWAKLAEEGLAQLGISVSS